MVIWSLPTTLTVPSLTSIVLIALIALIAVVEDIGSGKVVTNCDKLSFDFAISHGYLLHTTSDR
jgi:hypothetical protein